MSDQRAQWAKDLLNNTIFLEAIEQVKKGIDKEMDEVKPDDVMAMQSLVLLRQASTRIITHIANVANSEKVTQFNAKQKKKFF